MISRVWLFALALSSAAASAQAVPDPRDVRLAIPVTQPPLQREADNPVERAVRAFGICARREVRGLDPAATDEAAAASLMRACAAQFEAVESAASDAIAASRWPEDRQDRARAALAARLDLARQRVFERVRQSEPVNASVFWR
jgi:hypothetical protein